MSRTFLRFVASGFLLFFIGTVVVPYVIKATTPKPVATASVAVEPVVPKVVESMPVVQEKPVVKKEAPAKPAVKPVVATKSTPRPVVAAKSAVKSIVATTTVAHVSVSATKTTDQKTTASSNTFCLTAAMNALHDAVVGQMKKDIDKFGSGHDADVAAYKARISDAWSAMSEPYCGYGSNGVTAVRRSFQKTVDRARAAFLAATK
jgi:hypothetical protein